MTDKAWKPVIGYEGYYEISEDGQVKRIKKTMGTYGERLLTPFITRGYQRFELTKDKVSKKYLAHRLVAHAFIEVSDKPINHKDGNKKNNHYSNLEYVTTKENIQHAIKIGLKPAGNRKKDKKFIGVFKCSNANLWTAQLKKKHLGTFKTPEEAAKAYDKAAKEYYGEFARLNFK